MEAIMLRYAVVLALVPFGALAQAWQPPYCMGPNMALQYGPGTTGAAPTWHCVQISTTPVPPAPPPTQCITSNWDGTQWTCVPTDYLTAK